MAHSTCNTTESSTINHLPLLSVVQLAHIVRHSQCSMHLGMLVLPAGPCYQLMMEMRFMMNLDLTLALAPAAQEVTKLALPSHSQASSKNTVLQAIDDAVAHAAQNCVDRALAIRAEADLRCSDQSPS